MARKSIENLPPPGERSLADWLISERLVMTMIVVNTVALLLVDAAVPGSQRYELFLGMDLAAVLFFVLEAVLKMRRAGVRGYFASNWNRFDFAVLVLALPVLLSPWLDLGQFGWVVVLRLGRLFRLLRLLRFIPDHENLVDGVRRALKASVGVFLALLLGNLIFAIGATLLFGDLDPDNFGNPLVSLYSLFKVFTIEGWYEIPDQLAVAAREAGRPLLAIGARLYFVGAVLVGGILGLSLANAVFVDEMILDNTEEIEERLDRLADEMVALRRTLEDLGQRRGPDGPV
jgi:voltage-gated sodium channel